MGKIARLPVDLANQIAAGEVVERPASVVKELLENAIDAGARRVVVSVEFGGKKLVRVEDDGEGMSPEDARLAVERHATSKIRRADDLAAIATLGFRGEALPSLASVSHFVLRTRARGAASGTELRINAGQLASDVEVGMPEGTAIEVADLFYNLPARRKFLKSDGAETTQVSRIVTQLALCYPEVGFTLTSAGRRVMQVAPVSDLRERLYQLYGDRPDLLPVRREGAGLTVVGYIAALAEQGPTRGPQNVFVNRRVVKDRTIAHAIIDAYSVATTKEKSPEVHLFLDMPHEAVDVNVHPTKAEVRFREQSLVHEVVRRAIADAIGRGPAPELELRPTGPRDQVTSTLPMPGVYGGVFTSRWGSAHPGSVGGGDVQAAATPSSSPAGGEVGPMPQGTADSPVRPMMPLGQFRDTFIIAVDEDGICIIDQHVAHERVLFERVMQRLGSGRLDSQRLLDPLVIELAASGAQALVSHAADLDRLGYEVGEFGGTSVRVSAMPALLGRDEAEAALRALADDFEGFDRGSRAEDAIRQIAATTACHAAVKANYPLTMEKMRHILEELRQTAYSTICPHGRPVMLRLTRREVEKNFDRI